MFETTTTTKIRRTWNIGAGRPLAVLGPETLTPLVENLRHWDWDDTSDSDGAAVAITEIYLTDIDVDGVTSRHVTVTTAGHQEIPVPGMPDWLRELLMSLPHGPSTLGDPSAEPTLPPLAQPRFRAYVQSKKLDLSMFWNCPSCEKSFDDTATTCPTTGPGRAGCGVVVRDDALLAVAARQRAEAEALFASLPEPRSAGKIVDLSQVGRYWDVEPMRFP